MHRPTQTAFTWPTRPTATGQSACHFCREVRPLSELRLVHVPGRTSGVYVCRPDLAPTFCLEWQASGCREGIETEPSA
jgi:hypothetical protein